MSKSPLSRPALLLSAWRISNYADLTGKGGEMVDGRWHTAVRGKPIVYLTDAPATSILEVLVNIEGSIDDFPDSYQLLKVNATRAIPVVDLERKEHSFDALPEKHRSQALGDAWLASGESALARVPAVVAPYTWNYLFNPKHPAAAHVNITSKRRLPFDPRLFQNRS